MNRPANGYRHPLRYLALGSSTGHVADRRITGAILRRFLPPPSLDGQHAMFARARSSPRRATKTPSAATGRKRQRWQYGQIGFLRTPAATPAIGFCPCKHVFVNFLAQCNGWRSSCQRSLTVGKRGWRGGHALRPRLALAIKRYRFASFMLCKRASSLPARQYAPDRPKQK